MRKKKLSLITKYPKISVITPVLNGEKTLEKCLKSVLQLKYPKQKIEHIVIDGNSKDNSLRIIKKYKKNLKYWHSKKDRGLYDAMNIGLKKCTGEIIGILNCDDFYYKNTFKIVAKYFALSNIDFLFGSVVKQKIFHSFYPTKLWYTFNIYPSHSVSFFIKNKAQKKIGKYNLDFKYSADRDLFYRMIKIHKMVGKATKRKEIFGRFNIYGYSSKVPFFKKVIEEFRIRLLNKQNIIQLFFVTIAFVSYYFINKFSKKIN